MAIPASRSRSWMRFAAFGSMVLIIATTWPRAAPAMMPLAPRITCSVCAVVSTMVMVRADWRATSAADAAAPAPRATMAETLAPSVSLTTSA
jgi:hypothetical protein